MRERIALTAASAERSAWRLLGKAARHLFAPCRLLALARMQARGLELRSFARLAIRSRCLVAGLGHAHARARVRGRIKPPRANSAAHWHCDVPATARHKAQPSHDAKLRRCRAAAQQRRSFASPAQTRPVAQRSLRPRG